MSLPVSIALVDDTKRIGQDELAHATLALNAQLADIREHYPAVPPTTVGMYYEVTPNMWSIRIREQLDDPGALGYHTDDHHQPYALVELTDDWTVTVSHELAEMVVDPWGSRMHGARLPSGLEGDFARFGLHGPKQHVHYLLEVCDPCEATAYEVNGVRVSDFLLPAWYRSNPRRLPSYSFEGSITAPRQVNDGGYVSFANPDGEWFQVFNQGGALQVKDLGRFDRASWGSLRAFADAHARGADLT